MFSGGSKLKKAPSIKLKLKREKALLNGHPWVFSGAVATKVSGISAGDVVEVLANDGRWLARGTINPGSSLLVRVLTRDRDQAIDEGFIQRQIEIAARRRPHWPGRRLFHMEADGLPGLIVDQYQDVIVLQIMTPFIERHRDLIIETYCKLLSPRTVYERSDNAARKREGLEKRAGLAWGLEPPEYLKVEEECLAACNGAPMMMVDHVYHENLTPARVDEILNALD